MLKLAAGLPSLTHRATANATLPHGTVGRANAGNEAYIKLQFVVNKSR